MCGYGCMSARARSHQTEEKENHDRFVFYETIFDSLFLFSAYSFQSPNTLQEKKWKIKSLPSHIKNKFFSRFSIFVLLSLSLYFVLSHLLTRSLSFFPSDTQFGFWCADSCQCLLGFVIFVSLSVAPFLSHTDKTPKYDTILLQHWITTTMEWRRAHTVIAFALNAD